ncbi:ester cyclase [Shimazuella kribbensis]|uniref:ester cyclase n=1 Tax=Shimazuella kribbensis TaxID=139808 RepID=UPI000401AEDB|nr:ester cyclase [Shimazuella kribbensis]
MNVKGTHEGVFFGNAPTGKTIDIVLFRQYRVIDGKIAEHQGWIDMGIMNKQLGISI